MSTVVQLSGAVRPRRRSRTPYPIWVCPYRASVTRTSAATIASIAERIESRLAAMAGLEAAIREDLALLAFVDDPHPANALLTIEQASERLHVSRATMFRLMTDDRDLRYLKINKRTLFRPEDIEAFLEAKLFKAA